MDLGRLSSLALFPGYLLMQLHSFHCDDLCLSLWKINKYFRVCCLGSGYFQWWVAFALNLPLCQLGNLFLANCENPQCESNLP